MRCTVLVREEIVSKGPFGLPMGARRLLEQNQELGRAGGDACCTGGFDPAFTCVGTVLSSSARAATQARLMRKRSFTTVSGRPTISTTRGPKSLANMGRMANKNKFKDLITAPQARDQIVNYCNFHPGDAFYQAVMDVYDGFLDADP
jgi:hypothetical protein